ncbi:MAG: encapsulin-associated ferritin-like protein [Spirochaetota bacterium]
MSDYHEKPGELSDRTKDFVRALHSLREEIEAIDWYQQRVDVTGDEQLKAVLAHNRDEEIEHACMTLEWLRREMPGWDEELRTYLFTEKDITELE